MKRAISCSYALLFSLEKKIKAPFEIKTSIVSVKTFTKHFGCLKLFFSQMRIKKLIKKNTDTKERRSPQSSVKVLPWKVPTTDTLTQFSHAGAQSTHGGDTRKRSVVCIGASREKERDPPFTMGPLHSFPSWRKKKKSPRHLESVWVTPRQRGFSMYPTKAPPPLPLKTSSPGDQLYPSCPSSWPQAALLHQQPPHHPPD